MVLAEKEEAGQKRTWPNVSGGLRLSHLSCIGVLPSYWLMFTPFSKALARIMKMCWKFVSQANFTCSPSIRVTLRTCQRQTVAAHHNFSSGQHSLAQRQLLWRNFSFAECRAGTDCGASQPSENIRFCVCNQTERNWEGSAHCSCQDYCLGMD